MIIDSYKKLIKRLRTHRHSTGSRGFTIVETLIAITVLMIAVTGPMVVASKALTAALYSRDQMTATFLAQESLEYIRNVKDNNLGKTTPTTWLDGLYNSGNCTSGVACDSSSISGIQTCPNGGCPLSVGDEGYGYTVTNGTPSPFTRSYAITTPVGAAASEAQAAVTVKWYEGIVPNSLTLLTEMTDVPQ